MSLELQVPADPPASTGAGVGIAGGQQLVVTADVHRPNVQKAGKQFI